MDDEEGVGVGVVVVVLLLPGVVEEGEGTGLGYAKYELSALGLSAHMAKGGLVWIRGYRRQTCLLDCWRFQ